MSGHRAGRVVLDITTSFRWTGPPVGIVRVERELALWAAANLSAAQFAVFDPEQMAYCGVKTDVRPFLLGDAAFDTIGLSDPARPGRRKTDRAPAALRPLLLWIGQFRRMTLKRLELIRLTTASPRLQRIVARFQEFLMSQKYRKVMVRPDGTRRPFLPKDMILGAPIGLQADDALICFGAGWAHTNIEAIGALKSRVGFRFVLLCYDLIPLLFPQFYLPHDVEQFRAYMHEALARADLIVTTSQKIRQDCQAYCAQHNIAVTGIAVTPLGFDVGTRHPTAAALPDGLAPHRFVLMVSTIEPRKGHRLLYNVWQRLVAEGVIAAQGYKLVFVGRPGWMTADLVREIHRDREVADQIVMIGDADDRLLTALYDAAAFCVYPSRYEGFGLPVCEAYAHGKAVLVSSGGALPELAQGLSPCLDPEDEDAWYRTMRQWIERPDCKVPFEQAVERDFKQPTWAQAAANFFTVCKAGS